MKLDHKTMGTILAGLGLLLIIILVLIKINFDSQAVFFCEAVDADPDRDMSDCPAHQSNIPWLVMAGFGISFVILGAGIYFILLNNKEKKEFSAMDVSKLNKDELKIYNILNERKGSAYQSDLINGTGFSKVKMTRLLDKLEFDDKILERKRRGMTNIVILK
jgi:uncharacterized membrane protein